MAGLKKKVGTIFVLLLMIYLGVLGKSGVVEGGDRRRSLTRKQEEDLELERQVKLLNKPAVKSFKTEDGDIYDCVDVKKQIAFDHPLLRNHTIQMKPSSFPKGMIYKEPSNIGVKNSRCPPRTVLIRRTQKEDIIRAKSQVRRYPGNTHQLTKRLPGYHFATFRLVRSGMKYYGGWVRLGLDQPKVYSVNQFSDALLWVENGPIDKKNSIQVGWTVNPKVFGDNKTRIFSYWTADGFHKTGCFNLLCPGFVQVSRKKTIGSAYDRFSIYGEELYEDDFYVLKDPKSGNWWYVTYLNGGHEPVGYWPSSLFTSLRDSASTIAAGGEVYSPTSERSPQMGNGHLPPTKGDKIFWATYARRLQIVDENDVLVDPDPSLLNIQLDSPACYEVEPVIPHNHNWINSILFGGPGGACGI